MIKIKDLQRVQSVLNIKGLTDAAELKYMTIRQKITRSTELSVVEAEALEVVLNKLGIVIRNSR